MTNVYICIEKIYLYTSDNSSDRNFSEYIIFLMSLLIKILILLGSVFRCLEKTLKPLIQTFYIFSDHTHNNFY